MKSFFHKLLLITVLYHSNGSNWHRWMMLPEGHLSFQRDIPKCICICGIIVNSKCILECCLSQNATTLQKLFRKENHLLSFSHLVKLSQKCYFRTPQIPGLRDCLVKSSPRAMIFFPELSQVYFTFFNMWVWALLSLSAAWTANRLPLCS